VWLAILKLKPHLACELHNSPWPHYTSFPLYKTSNLLRKAIGDGNITVALKTLLPPQGSLYLCLPDLHCEKGLFISVTLQSNGGVLSSSLLMAVPYWSALIHVSSVPLSQDFVWWHFKGFLRGICMEACRSGVLCLLAWNRSRFVGYQHLAVPSVDGTFI